MSQLEALDSVTDFSVLSNPADALAIFLKLDFKLVQKII